MLFRRPRRTPFWAAEARRGDMGLRATARDAAADLRGSVPRSRSRGGEGEGRTEKRSSRYESLRRDPSAGDFRPTRAAATRCCRARVPGACNGHTAAARPDPGCPDRCPGPGVQNAARGRSGLDAAGLDARDHSPRVLAARADQPPRNQTGPALLLEEPPKRNARAVRAAGARRARRTPAGAGPVPRRPGRSCEVAAKDPAPRAG